MLPNNFILILMNTDMINTNEVLAPIRDRDPFAYVLGVLLMSAIGGLLLALKVLWSDNKKLLKEKDDLHESKLEFAIESTDAIKEAINILKLVHVKIDPLVQGDNERRLFQGKLLEKLKILEHKLDVFIKHMEDYEKK